MKNLNQIYHHIRGMVMTLVLSLLYTTALSQQPAIQGDWNTQADQYRGRNGEQFTFYFPPGGTVSSRVWGTNLYTDDCSIASAAVHAGIINASSGGTVTIEIKPGANSYVGTTRNGVTSKDYGNFAGSFIFISGHANTGDHTAIRADWATQADNFRGRNGEQFTYYFPPGGTISSRVWGTGLYTDDCSIATAAVHAGLITTANGGTVTIEIRPGANAYSGSVRNGVTSKDYGSFYGSFVFVRSGKVNPPPVARIVQADWTTRADQFRGNNYKRYTLSFPPGTVATGRLWGTDLYTDDSYIAAAAVHAGVLVPANGGTVTIEIRPGAASYSGSSRNGVTSGNWGAFTGSFVFIR